MNMRSDLCYIVYCNCLQLLSWRILLIFLDTAVRMPFFKVPEIPPNSPEMKTVPFDTRFPNMNQTRLLMSY